MPGRDDYQDDSVRACLSVLLELFTYLKPYRDHIVLIGGWVPFFLTEGMSDEVHIGSLDVDLALDANKIPETEYETILERLKARGYQQAQTSKEKSFLPAMKETSNSSMERCIQSESTFSLPNTAEPVKTIATRGFRICLPIKREGATWFLLTS